MFISVRLLSIADTAEVFQFEQDNRTWFEQWVPLRSDKYQHIDTLHKLHSDFIAEAAVGSAYMHLVLNTKGEIIGRINLMHVENGSADLGYRIAQNATGQGVASKAVALIKTMARDSYALSQINASCLISNPASKAVLLRNGFTPTSSKTIILKNETTTLQHFQVQLP